MPSKLQVPELRYAEFFEVRGQPTTADAVSWLVVRWTVAFSTPIRSRNAGVTSPSTAPGITGDVNISGLMPNVSKNGKYQSLLFASRSCVVEASVYSIFFSPVSRKLK